MANVQEQDVAKYVLPLGKPAGKSIRLYYVVDCGASDHGTPFPSIKMRPPLSGSTGTNAIRQIFREDRNVSVTEARSDMVRIFIGRVPTDILQTRLSLVTLAKNERYDPNLAISAIEQTKEMEAARKSLKVNGPVIFTGPVQQPIPGLPHLPKYLKSVTADRALDIIAKTFDGVVSYGICSGENDKDPNQNKTYWIGFDAPFL